MKRAALVGFFIFALTYRSPRTQALDSASLEDCASSPDAVLIDYEKSKSYLFRNKELYRIDLPRAGGLVSLPPNAFPEERQNCFDFTRGGRVRFEDLTAIEMKSCQDAKRRAHFASATKAELERAAELIMNDYFLASLEVSSSLMNKEPANEARPWAQEKLRDLSERFSACEGLTGLNAAARETQTDVLERLRAVSPPRREPSTTTARMKTPANSIE